MPSLHPGADSVDRLGVTVLRFGAQPVRAKASGARPLSAPRSRRSRFNPETRVSSPNSAPRRGRPGVSSEYPRVAWGLLLLVASLSLTSPAAARQAAGSRLLTVDHWAYALVEQLRSRGHLDGLNPTVQPYRRLDIARELARIDVEAVSPPVSDWVRLLRAEFARELRRLEGADVPSMGMELGTTLLRSSSRRLDVLRPTGEAGTWRRHRIGAWTEVGGFAAVARLLENTYFDDDPDGAPLGQGKLGRNDHAYLAYTFSRGMLTFGRQKQNWSTLGTAGVMVGPYATTIPELTFEFHFGPFALRSLTGELESMTDPASGQVVKRYLTAHRVDFMRRNLVISIGEGLLYASPTGLQLRYLNPLEVTFATRGVAPKDATVNVVQQAQVWFGNGRIEVYGEFMLDDIDVEPVGDAEPLTYAFTTGVRVPSLGSRIDLEAEYQQVSAFAYRTPNVVDDWSFLARGLGETFSDYDRLTVAADLYPSLPGLGALRVTPTLQYLRQGEGDFRLPVPPRPQHVASPALFLGTTERTFRLGVRGRLQLHRYLQVTWDAGQNWVRNAGHVTGADRSDFTALVQVRGTFEFTLPVP